MKKIEEVRKRMKTLNDLVRDQILAEGPDMTETIPNPTSQEQYQQYCDQYVDHVLDSMTNTELLERISVAMQKGLQLAL